MIELHFIPVPQQSIHTESFAESIYGVLLEVFGDQSKERIRLTPDDLNTLRAMMKEAHPDRRKVYEDLESMLIRYQVVDVVKLMDEYMAEGL